MGISEGGKNAAAAQMDFGFGHRPFLTSKSNMVESLLHLRGKRARR
jgi:hypothetical protein